MAESDLADLARLQGEQLRPPIGPRDDPGQEVKPPALRRRLPTEREGAFGQLHVPRIAEHAPAPIPITRIGAELVVPDAGRRAAGPFGRRENREQRTHRPVALRRRQVLAQRLGDAPRLRQVAPIPDLETAPMQPADAARMVSPGYLARPAQLVRAQRRRTPVGHGRAARGQTLRRGRPAVRLGQKAKFVDRVRFTPDGKGDRGVMIKGAALHANPRCLHSAAARATSYSPPRVASPLSPKNHKVA